MNAQRLKKWRVRFSFLPRVLLLFGVLSCSLEAEGLSGKERKDFVSYARQSVRQGLSHLFPKGYKTVSTDANFAGRSHDGKRKQVIRDASGQLHTVFVRIFYEGMTLEKRQRVVAVTRAMGTLWGEPQLLWHDPDHRVMITRFIEPKMSVQDYFQNPENLKAFVRRLKESHKALRDLKITFPPDSLLVRAKRRLTELLELVPSLEPRLSKAESFLKDFEVSHAAVVHGDVQADNIIIGVAPYLVDWTEMSTGDVFEDLGGLSAHVGFTPEQDRQLLEAYFDDTCNRDLEKLARYATLNRLNRGCFLLREGWKQLQKTKANLPPKNTASRKTSKFKRGSSCCGDDFSDWLKIYKTFNYQFIENAVIAAYPCVHSFLLKRLTYVE